MAKKNRRDIAVNVLLSVVVVLLVLVIAEILLRTFVVPIVSIPRDSDHRVKVVADAEVGYRLKENQLITSTNGYFNVQVQTNDMGYRDIYNEDYESPGIIAIGDSYTFGHGIEAEETWVEQLQNEIKLNVINLGVFGYAPWQYEPVVRRIHQTVQPVNVVLFAMSWNDAVADQRFEVNEGVSPEIRKNLEEKDAVVVLRESALYKTLLDRTAIGLLLQESARKVSSYLGVKTSEQQDINRIANIESTKEILAQLDKYLDGIGAKLVIVHIASRTFVITDRWKDYSRRHNFSRHVVRDKFSDWAAMNGIYFYDAIDDLEERYLSSGKRRTSVLLPVDDHYNRSGNEVIFKVFHKILNEAKLIESVRK